MSTSLWLQHADWLATVAAIVGVSCAGLAFVALRDRARRGVLFGASAVHAREPVARDALLAAAAILIGIALLGPRIGEETRRISTAGIDLVLLVDTSQSMDARDQPPSRLHRARALAEDLLRSLGPGDRVALAAFSARGVLLTPLTNDAEALVHMLPALDSGLIAPGGSALDAGVEAALAAFEPGAERARVLLVLSDGETSQAPAQSGGATARRAGVRAVAVAFGTRRGATVPDHGTPLRDGRDRVVISRRSLPALESLAEATGGAVLESDDWGELPIDALQGALRAGLTGAGAEDAYVSQTRIVPRAGPFAACALGLLLLEWLPWTRIVRLATAGRRRPARRARVLAATAVLGVGWATLGAERPSDDARVIREALDQIEAGDRAAARRTLHFAALVARDPALAALAHYDLGVLAAEEGRLAEARDHFFDAVAVAPDDTAARANLEWTLRALAAAPPSASGLTDASEPPTPRPPRPGDDPGEASPQAAAASEREAEMDPAREDDAPETTPTSGTSTANPAEERKDPAARRPPLDDAQLAQWRARVQDDPGRSLRARAREERDRRGETIRSEQRW